MTTQLGIGWRATTALLALLTAFTFANAVIASPVIKPGDLALRHDIQRLADYGIIKGPTSTWPLAWGPILEDLREADISSLPPAIADSLSRLRYRGRLETHTDLVGYNVEVGVAEKPTRIRSFQDTPRGNAEVSVGAEWLGNWFSIDLNVQAVDSDQDSDEFRADNSMLGVAVGNWSIAASTQERWWGPGWDGSIILSNNARPFPSLTLDRVFTDAFKTKWLSWLGPWDLNVTFGQLERNRVVPNAQFFGLRFNFRPIKTLEIGISRSAQWCGDGRPCDFDTFVDLFLGKDNRTSGQTVNDEPGNQMAGFDVRWAPRIFGSAFAIYGQVIGEDEAGGFPSRYLGQFGGEWSGHLFDRWSTRVFGEFAGTTCQFHESSELFNCAYNHGIYETGYRYRARSIGHGADNDARVLSAGLVMVDADRTEWRSVIRYAALNRGGNPDPANSLTPTPIDLTSVDVAYSRVFDIGTIELSAGFENRDDSVSGTSTSDARFYLQWRQAF